MDGGGGKILQTIKLRFETCNYHSIWVHNTSRIHVDQNAILKVIEGRLDINLVNLEKAGPYRPCLFWIGEDARFECANFAIFEGGNVVVLKGGRLRIGNYTYMNASTIQCAKSITIGCNCAIGNNVLIQDTDFHVVLDEKGMAKPIYKPIVIGDHVWVCDKATILKGVTIGDGAIIAAGAVVTKDVPARCLVAGNPAQVVRENVIWR